MNLEERNKSMKEFFTKKIDTYDDVHLELMDTKNIVVDTLDTNIKKVLDLGAGTGLELIPLFERFPNINVTAIDITESMLNKLKTRDFASKVKTICGDFFKVEFADYYDAVISTSARHHVTKEEKLKLYKKIYNCLNKGGQFINSDCFVNTLEEEKEAMLEYIENPYSKPHIDTPLCIQNEKEILNKVGFTDIEFIDSKTNDRYKLLKARKK